MCEWERDLTTWHKFNLKMAEIPNAPGLGVDLNLEEITNTRIKLPTCRCLITIGINAKA